MFSCHVCGNASNNSCSKCKTNYYCSRECQLKDWPQHKQQCNISALGNKLLNTILSKIQYNMDQIIATNQINITINETVNTINTHSHIAHISTADIIADNSTKVCRITLLLKDFEYSLFMHRSKCGNMRERYCYFT